MKYFITFLAMLAFFVPIHRQDFFIGMKLGMQSTKPSTVCGTTGLRPTFGRVSRTGTMALIWSMDKIGPICRTVADCFKNLESLAAIGSP